MCVLVTDPKDHLGGLFCLKVIIIILIGAINVLDSSMK